jgi:hypothetical protein
VIVGPRENSIAFGTKSSADNVGSPERAGSSAGEDLMVHRMQIPQGLRISLADGAPMLDASVAYAQQASHLGSQIPTNGKAALPAPAVRKEAAQS